MSMSITIYPPSISIHAPRTGSDDERGGIAGEVDFNPRSPHGERPGPHSTNKNAISFQSTLPARGATVVVKVPICRAAISIHAPRTGSDEHDLSVPCLRRQFQSTLPARGATNHNSRSSYACHISIHAPRTGSDPRDATHLHQHHISIHAPRTGSDSPDESRERNRPISIHAPRTGSDGTRRSSCGSRSNFNPRSPHGERHRNSPRALRRHNFNPRSPHGERRHERRKQRDNRYFNPRSLHGERHRNYDDYQCANTFQSTLPARGATIHTDQHRKEEAPYFNPRSLHGERLHAAPAPCERDSISIHAPCTGSDGGSQNENLHD